MLDPRKPNQAIRTKRGSYTMYALKVVLPTAVVLYHPDGELFKNPLAILTPMKKRNLTQLEERQIGVEVAGAGGFEPPQADPESAVLPLDDAPTYAALGLS